MDEFQALEQEFGITGFEPVDFEVTLLEPRPFRPFKSSEEYLYAMKEDLAEWLNGLYEGLKLTADNFLELMETGVILCKHANNVVRKAREYFKTVGGNTQMPIPDRNVVYRPDVLPETFHARDNISNFISWCRALAIKECLLFETDDLVLRKNERSFILCLLEVARRGAQFGMPAPLLVQFEQEIDAELANDDGYLTTIDHHVPQVVTNDLRSLHERVVELLSRCTCPSQFPMIRVADGKYRIGDTKILIFVRILRSHVMVRVGGGWDTLEHYLDKHDPCRCRSGHRLATSAKLTMQQQGKSNIPSMHVTYHRPPQAPVSALSPITPRRSVSYSSPVHPHHHPHPGLQSALNNRMESQARYCHPPGSDDSSASNPSLHDGRRPKKSHGRRKRNSAGSTSEEASDEEEEYDQPTEMSSASPGHRMREVFHGTAPSSWQYSSGSGGKHGEQIPSSMVASSRRTNGTSKSSSATTRLPSLTHRNQHLSPPRVVKVSPQMKQSTTWSEQRSQSSEDLYQDDNLVPVDNKVIFYSRGTSPVNIKGRRSMSTSGSNNKDYPDNFRRGDPFRHSSYHTPRTYSKKSSPPRAPHMTTRDTRKVDGQNNRQHGHPELSSPVMKKLLSSNLCSDENFLKKIESLISEYESNTHCRRDSQNGPRSLPLMLYDNSSSNPRRSKKDSDGRSPSKIPIPKRI